jgi:hypothetical protein
MSGEGEFADTIYNLFQAACKKNGLNEVDFHLSTKHFQRPGQMDLFQPGDEA